MVKHGIGANDEKENLTVLITANAEGAFAPPMPVFNYQRLPGALPENFF